MFGKTLKQQKGGLLVTNSDVIVKQRRSLLIFAQRHSVSEACRVFGCSRTTFYKIKQQFIETGSLAPKVRRKPRMPNETSLSKKKILLKLVKEQPMWGPQRYAYAFRAQGISYSAHAIWYHLKKYGLNHRHKRLVYLEALEHKNQPITERNLREIKRACNKAKQGLWPGHIVGVDTFYVGNMKGVGRIYQFSGIDLCSRFAWAHLYTDKSQLASIDFVEKQLLPLFYQNGVDLESILSDNGSEYIGSQFQTMLTAYGITHYKIPKGKPMFNGCCERFQRTLHEEFYQRVFRTKLFKSVNELQKDLNNYLSYYNFERAHFGISENGELPINILKSKRSFLRQRFQKLLT